MTDTPPIPASAMRAAEAIIRNLSAVRVKQHFAICTLTTLAELAAIIARETGVGDLEAACGAAAKQLRLTSDLLPCYPAAVSADCVAVAQACEAALAAPEPETKEPTT